MQEINLTKEELLKACGWFSGYTLIIFLIGLTIGSLLVGLAQSNQPTLTSRALALDDIQEKPLLNTSTLQFAEANQSSELKGSEQADSIAGSPQPSFQAETPETEQIAELEVAEKYDQVASVSPMDSTLNSEKANTEILDNRSVVESSVAKDNAFEETVMEQTAIEESVSAPGYTLQVGLFAQADNARTLYKKLSDKGFEAQMAMDSSSGRKLFRVSVGDYISRDDAQAMREILLGTAGLKSVYIKEFYRPLSKVAFN